MLTPNDLALSDPDLELAIRRATHGLEADSDAPQPFRDAALLLELDGQVRNGGFAQYFFNASCLNAFDAWFLCSDVDPSADAILSLALRRVGVEFGLPLDLHALVASGGGEALGPSFGGLLDVYRNAHRAPGALLEQFVAFRDRLASAKGDLPGFDELNMRFFRETQIPATLVKHVRANARAYVS
jgi:hypothetical protein